MFAVVANGMQTICRTQRQLDNILALYTYPKFQKFEKEEDALKWLRIHSRASWSMEHDHNHYGDTCYNGFADVTYVIAGNTIHYYINTERLGFINIVSQDMDTAVKNGRENIEVIVSNVVLNDLKITSHVIAVHRILRLIGRFVDVNIRLPDMSVYLAVTRYAGKNYIIRSLKREIEERLGGVSFTVGGDTNA